MLATLQSVLRKASRAGYAVGAFNVSDLEQVQAVILAAAELRSPVIVNTSEKAIAYAGLSEIAALVRVMASRVSVPVVLNLDHGRHVRLAKECLDVGYTGIMFDGSTLPFAENIKRTKAVRQAAQKKGVGTEGELGQVKYPDDLKKSPVAVMTDPAQAADFVRRTGIDAFAVAIGNTHGLPVPDEHLDFERLQQIRKKVSVPLVLHGASGTPASAIRRAIRLGIAKINIDTDLRLAFTAALRETLRDDKNLYDPRSALLPAREAMMAVVMKKMKLFGSVKRA